MNSNCHSERADDNKQINRDKTKLQRIVAALNKNYPFFEQKYNIKEISIIGLYARGEQTKESDLDIMVDFKEPIGWEVVDLRDDLEKLLGIKVDLVLKSGVMQRKRLYSGILEDAVYVKA
ncbi:nucleotidyltransferase family protein [Methanoplanus endosymbiosus]|uniref:protein adenylyltransferase n=1 Tax=Methanoplanus endosymbiosus TaxID=33865 RepID=A0A9E7PN98_9EURY|nr:nucleotidyltransferase family protein [Methanoplanus endosymbiosus]UUX92995.1 nucleotidyltransferase family protein [Methanoplanus endosymbiosus]